MTIAEEFATRNFSERRIPLLYIATANIALKAYTGNGKTPQLSLKPGWVGENNESSNIGRWVQACKDIYLDGPPLFESLHA